MVRFRELAEKCVSLSACHYHYISMARRNWADYFKEDLVSLKKYLYVLRPIYASRWIERYQSTPPVEFYELVQGAGEPGPVGCELERLLEAKSQASELGVGPRRDALDGFIVSELERLAALQVKPSEPVAYELLDSFFLGSLG